jgi:putative hydrolase of the HAD superfamily
MTIKGIIFDLYGTLINILTDENLEEIYRGIGQFLTYQGLTLSPGEVRERYWELLRQQKSGSREEHFEMNALAIWDALLKTAGMSDEAARQRLSLTLAQLFRAISRKRLGLYPDVKKVLEALRPGYRLALVSDAQPCFALPEIKAVGLEGYFESVIISGSYGFRKPDARLYQAALSALNLTPAEAIFVGNDMFRDMYGAQQVGMKTIYIDTDQGVKTHPGVTPDVAAKFFADVAAGIERLVR